MRIAREEAETFLKQLPAWAIVVQDEERLQCVFKFRNFVDALAFTNLVGELAEAHQHHPLIITEWGRVTVQWWTHAIHGLHLNDFILAAKTDELATTSE